MTGSAASRTQAVKSMLSASFAACQGCEHKQKTNSDITFDHLIAKKHVILFCYLFAYW